MSRNLTHRKIKKENSQRVLQGSSTFRGEYPMLSPCSEIRELFDADLSTSYELIANSTPVCIWTLARSLKWHFRMAPVDSLQQLIPLAEISTDPKHQSSLLPALEQQSPPSRPLGQDKHQKEKRAPQTLPDSAGLYAS